MPIKIKLKNVGVETETQLTPVKSPFKAQIDQLAKMDAIAKALQDEIRLIAAEQLKKLEPLILQIEDKKKALLEEVLAYHEEEDPDQEFTELGKTFQVKVSKKINERKITDMKALYELIENQSEGLFLQLAQIKLGDCDKYLTPAELEAVITKSRGKRTAKLEPRKGTERS